MSTNALLHIGTPTSFGLQQGHAFVTCSFFSYSPSPCHFNIGKIDKIPYFPYISRCCRPYIKDCGRTAPQHEHPSSIHWVACIGAHSLIATSQQAWLKVFKHPTMMSMALPYCNWVGTFFNRTDQARPSRLATCLQC